MGFSVYFNAKREEDTLVLAVVSFEGFYEFEPIIKEVEAKPSATFYEDDIEAMILALETIRDEEFDNVVLYNQHRLLFQWLSKQNHDNKLRNMYYKKIRELMQELVENGVSIGYKVVKGNKNEAKKVLQKYTVTTEEVSDLTGLFKADKVVSFNRKAK